VYRGIGELESPVPRGGGPGRLYLDMCSIGGGVIEGILQGRRRNPPTKTAILLFSRPPVSPLDADPPSIRREAGNPKNKPGIPPGAGHLSIHVWERTG